ncbi:hypothetical protein [Sphingobium lactosutens]|uniref:hypothetical protein n=1 Tax=Sphingobium lactosutens TaxID=522773 RepID=UPI0015B84FB3|nr:hypothetical protein [Sphingobium lactosutens]
MTTNVELGNGPGLGLAPLSEAEVTEMANLGILRRPIDSFSVGAFRYSKLKEAIAQAKRQLSERTRNGSKV